MRVIEASRWDRHAIEQVRGIHRQLKITKDDHRNADDVERAERPHEFKPEDADPEAHAQARDDKGAPEDSGPKRVRITKKGHRTLWHNSGLPKVYGIGSR